MKKLLLLTVLFMSANSFAALTTIHVWDKQTNTYHDEAAEAEWNETIKAYVIAAETMNNLNRHFQNHDFYANEQGFWGDLAGYIRWQYPVVSQARAEQAAANGEVFEARDASGAVQTQQAPAPVVIHAARVAERGIFAHAVAPNVNRLGESLARALRCGDQHVGKQ